MPLSPLQQRILACLAPLRTPDSYLAGAAAIHFTPQSVRTSDDLDFFHDSETRVASAFGADESALRGAGFDVTVELSQPGFIRAVVVQGDESTRIDWAHDSAWRFLPTVRDPLGGYLLHPIDLAVNKVLTLAGRDEPRDFVDILYVHAHALPAPALVWAACGKDPGFGPLALLELLRRRGRCHPRDVERLQLHQPFDLQAAKVTWLGILDDIEAFARARPPAELGCLYWNTETSAFVCPPLDAVVGATATIRPHFGHPGGVLPQPSGRTITDA